jgi:hypothetical protein
MRHTKAKVTRHTLPQLTCMSAEIIMTIISTDGHVDSQIQSSLLQRARERAFVVSFLSASAIATVGWLYVLGQGAVAVTSWLLF